MKIQSYISVVSLVILLCFVACKESTVITPTEPEEEIRIEDYVYNTDSVQTACQIQNKTSLISCISLYIISISKNKDRVLIFGGSPPGYKTGSWGGNVIYILNIESNIHKFEPFDLTVLQSSTSYQYFDVIKAHFCPYDNDLLLAYIATNTSEGTNRSVSYDWYYYNLSTKKYTRLELDSPNHSYYRNNSNLIRWSSNSTPGNDQFIWENNSILSYPSGSIQQNATGRTFQENEKIFSISPDMKKVFTVINNELFLNGSSVPNSKYLFRRGTPISWSDDSKRFLGVGIPQNPKAYLHVVYQMKEGSTTDFSINNIIDLTRKHCNIQNPTFLLFAEELNSIFISDSTIAVNLALPSEKIPEITNVNLNGDILQRYTFSPINLKQ